MHIRVLVPLLALVLVAPPSARADDQAKANAEQVFHRGEALAAQGRYAEACESYASSLALEPTIGTRIYLADCLEHLGKIASAWGLFREAAGLAAQSPNTKTQAQLATERADALLPRLPRLTVRVPAVPRGTAPVITRDDLVIERTLWGQPLYVDPGPHDVRMSGSGLRPYATTIVIAETEEITVDVVVLPERGTIDTASTPWWRTRRTAAILGGAGVAATATGLVFGYLAKRDWDRAYDRHLCAGDDCYTVEGQELTDRSRRYAMVSTVVTAAGAVTLAGAIYLYVTADDESRIAPFAADGGGGVTWSGRF